MTKPKISKATIDQLRAHLVHVEKQINAAGQEVPVTLIRERRAALGAISRLTGEGVRLNERAILKTAAWRRVLATATEALKPWPEAALALARALDELEAR